MLSAIRHSVKPLIIIITFILFLFRNDCSAQVTCISSGNFTSPSIWSPAAPVAGQFITVNAGVTLTIDSITPQTGDLIINGRVVVNNTSQADLITGGNITVNAGASLENNGRIEFVTLGRNFTMNSTASYIHNPLLSDSVDESIFYNSIETFSTTSNLTILKWNDGSIPLGDQSRIANSFFGNLTLNANVPGGVWDQDGYFAFPALNRIRGKLTVSTGTIVMDDGTGNSTQIFLAEVLVNGTGNIIFQKGYDRNLAITTANFTVNSLSAQPTIMMDSSMGILTFNVGGNFVANSSFTGIRGSVGQLGSDGRITVTGNLSVTGGDFNLITRVDAPLRVTVNGTTTLNNSTPGGKVSFLDGGNFGLTVTTANMVVSGGTNNYLFGSPSSIMYCKGAGTFTITNDLTVNGVSTTYAAWSDSNSNAIKFNVGRDVFMSADAQFIVGHTNGQLTFKTTRNYTHTNGRLIAQEFDQNADVDSVIVGGNFLFNSATATDFFKGNRGQGNLIFKTTGSFTVQNSGTANNQGVIGVDSSASNMTFTVGGNFVQNGGRFCGNQNGSGNVSFTTTGMLDVNAGNFTCTSNSTSSIPGNITFTVNSIDYDGGFFSAYNACNNANSNGVFNITGNCKVNFSSVSDQFSFVGVAKTGFDINNLITSITIGGAFTISGSNGTFISSLALGQETISMGSISIATGNNSFNTVPGSTLGNGHIVNFTVTGNVLVSGGSTYFSAATQAITMTVNGDFSLSGGTVSMKGGDNATASTLNILGGYTQSNGDFYFHNAPTDELNSGASITMTVNSNGDNAGDFSHTGGTFYFDNATTTPSTLNLSLNIKSPNYTLGGTGLMTMSNAGTGAVYANLTFSRNGTILYNRTGSYVIQQVLQTIQDNCTLDLVTGDLIIASNNTKRPTLPDWCTVMSLGTLNMRTNHLQSNRLNTYSGITVLGRVKLQHPNGLYNGTVNAAFSTTLADSLDYFLSSGSTIEYNGSDNQIISGIGLGKALSTSHKYFNLAINFTGTADVEFVYPTNNPNDSAVMVRNTLSLLSGELNLDDDHNPSNGGGRWIVLESQSSAAVSRTSGYIRSETENGNGLVKWIIGSNTSNHVIPFGYNSTNYIPLTATVSSGTAGNFYAGTYHSASTNTPYPPGVLHLNNPSGFDMSSSTIDRFWYLKTTSSAVMNVLFKCTAAEAGSIADFRAIRWLSSTSLWTNPPPGTQTTQVLGVQANSLSDVNNWWTAAGTLQFTISASAGSHGAISPSGNSTVNSGSNLTYNITPDACYQISDGLVDGISVDSVSSYTFTNISANHSISASFIQQSFIITATAGTNGSISPAGSTSVLCGTNMTFNISPDPCYTILDVVVDGISQGPVNSYTFVNTTAPHTITASFQQLTYSVTATAGPNGSISPSGTSIVNCGSGITFSITPNTCYMIQDVLVDGVSQGAVSSFSFVNINAPHTISASFIQITYSISTTSGTGGNVSPAGSGSIPCGSNQTYTITADPCYVIADVLVDGISQGPVSSYTFTNIQTSHTLSATFSQISYSITASSGANGNISPSGIQNILCGNNQTYTFTPDPCYAISDVLIDGISAGVISSYTFTNINTSHTIHVDFVQLNYTVTVNSGTHGSLSPSGSNIITCGQNLTITIAPDACYFIGDVIVDGVSQGPLASYSFTNVTSPHSISAVFTQFSYQITSSSGPNGNVSPAGTNAYGCGTNQEYFITPDLCYAIADVLIDGVSQGPISSYMFTDIENSHTISATFVQQTFDITSSSDPHGTISPSGITSVICGQDQSYTMTVDSCYIITDVIVNGDSYGPLTSFTFTDVERPLSIHVVVEQLSYPVTVAAGPHGQISTGYDTIAYCGESLTLPIIPDPCYTVEDVIVDGVSQGPVSSYTFTNVTTAHSISATFTLLNYAITASSGTNGSISDAGTLTLACGSNQSYTITPASCFAIEDVLVDGVSIGPVSAYTFTSITTSHTIEATFVQISYPIVASSGLHGSVSPNGTTSSLCGDSLSYSIQADPCYSIADVLVDGISQGPVSSYTFTNISSTHTIHANFTRSEFPIVATTSVGGTISPNGSSSVLCGDSITYTILPDSCYFIQDVIVDGLSSGAMTTYSFLNVTASHTIHVIFSQPVYTITASAGSGGTVSPLGVSNVTCGGSQTFTITPNSAYLIQDVIVDGISVGALSTYSFTNVGTNHTIHATFYPACTAPQITCIQDLSSNTSATSCGIVLNYSNPVLSGTSPSLSYSLSGSTTGSGSGSGSGSYFNSGTTVVTLTATNACGSAQCSFNILVVDSVVPEITCPVTITLTADPGLCSSTGSIGAATATDNCSVSSLVATPAGPYPVGTTVVTWTAADSNGNTTSCNQNVIVTDTEVPSITCPSTVISYSTSPALGTPIVSDNCGGYFVMNNAPPVFSYGNTSVVWTITDASGNVSSCSQIVTVLPLHDTLNLKLYIQGYFNSGLTMNAALYNTGISGNPADCDTIQVCLMDSATLLPVECMEVVLNANGETSCVFPPAVFGNSYYIRVKHRNAIETWSANPVSMNAAVSYDFSTNSSQAYGNNMVEVSTGIWAFWSGDIGDGINYGIQDGGINDNDFSLLESAINSISSGYDIGDLTGDGIVESSDYSLLENNIGFLILSTHP